MKARRVGLAALSATMLAGLLLTPAGAADNPEDRKRQVDASVAELKTDVHESTAAVAAAVHLLEDADARLPGAREALDAARRAVLGAQDHQGEVAARLAETLARADATALDLDRVRADLEHHQDAVGIMARQAYIGGDFVKLSIVMNAQTPDDFTSGLAYLRTVNRSERATLGRLAEEKADLALLRSQLEAIRMQVVAEEAEAEQAVEATAAAQDLAETATKEVEALVDQRTKALEIAEDERAAVTEKYRQMRAESDRLAKIIAERAAAARRAAERAAEKARKAGKRVVKATSGLLRYPVVGPVTSSYGMRYHPILRYNKLHTGVDFGVPSGTKVRAALGGTVLESYFNSAYGNRIVVDHGLVDGVYLVTTYNHLSRRGVGSGDKVDQGDVIGRSGNTGWSTGPHLHFETMEDGHFVNPMKWLR